MLKAQTRRSHKKSKNGCHNCKKKHLKCDEQGPPCVNCAIRKSECVYPTPPPPGDDSNSGEAGNDTAGPSASSSGPPPPEKKRKRAPPGSRQSRIVNARLRAAAAAAGNSSISDPFIPPAATKITPHAALILNCLPSPPTSTSTSKKSSSSSDSSTISFPSSPHIPPLPSAPHATTNGPLPTRFLELELMHRWMTRTWTGLYGFPGNDRDMLHSVPQLAVRHPCLMNGLLALAAADMSANTSSSFSASFGMVSAAGDSRRYLTTALEYGNESSVQLRETMRGGKGITKENLYALFNASMLIALTRWVLSSKQKENVSVLEKTLTYFDMQYGAFLIVKHNPQWYLSYPGTAIEVVRYLQSDELKQVVLDRETKRALRNLERVSAEVRIPGEQGGLGRSPLYSEISTYRMALLQTKLAFVVEAQGILKGMCLSLTTATGPDFITAVRGRDPMALLIMCFFAVAFDKLGQEEKIGWWVGRDTGRDLVAELDGLLRGASVLEVEAGREALAWTRKQVGLPPTDTVAVAVPVSAPSAQVPAPLPSSLSVPGFFAPSYTEEIPILGGSQQY